MNTEVPPRYRGDAREGTEARRAWSVPLRDERLQDLALWGDRVGTTSAVSLNTATYCNDSMTDCHCASSNQSVTATTHIVAAVAGLESCQSHNCFNRQAPQGWPNHR
jgi:hypothetical protein